MYTFTYVNINIYVLPYINIPICTSAYKHVKKKYIHKCICKTANTYIHKHTYILQKCFHIHGIEP